MQNCTRPTFFTSDEQSSYNYPVVKYNIRVHKNYQVHTADLYAIKELNQDFSDRVYIERYLHTDNSRDEEFQSTDAGAP